MILIGMRTMTKRHLDFHNTCPDVDRGVSLMEDTLDSLIYDLVQELSPKFGDTDAAAGFISDTVKYFSQQLEPIYENVRQSNVDIRRAADYQIDELCDKIDDLEHELSTM